MNFLVWIKKKSGRRIKALLFNTRDLSRWCGDLKILLRADRSDLWSAEILAEHIRVKDPAEICENRKVSSALIPD